MVSGGCQGVQLACIAHGALRWPWGWGWSLSVSTGIAMVLLGAVAVPGQCCDLRCHFASPEATFSRGFPLVCIFKSYLRDHFKF